MMRVALLLVFSFLSLNGIFGQQQQMYTQFMYNKMALNPAYAGNETYLSGTLMYRDPWNGFTLYMLCLKEWNLDSFMYRYLWNPLKFAGRKLDFLSLNRVIYFLIPAYLIGLWSVYNRELMPDQIEKYLHYVFSIIAFITVLKAFTERKIARVSWLLVLMNHFWVALAISFNEQFSFSQVHYYLSGVAFAGVLGFECLRWLRSHEGSIDLDQFHGHSYKHPKFAIVFLLACLGVCTGSLFLTSYSWISKKY